MNTDEMKELIACIHLNAADLHGCLNVLAEHEQNKADGLRGNTFDARQAVENRIARLKALVNKL